MDGVLKAIDLDAKAFFHWYGSANLARDMLSPGDNLSRALDSISSDLDNPKSLKNLIDGLKLVEKEFMTILEKHGVKKII